MRLIDADALEKEISVSHSMIDDCGIKTGYEICMRLVEDAPTIEPERKKGHWIRHPEQKNIFNGKTIECSECHEKYTVRYVEDELFCRHCGADMREPEDIPMEYFESGGR